MFGRSARVTSTLPTSCKKASSAGLRREAQIELRSSTRLSSPRSPAPTWARPPPDPRPRSILSLISSSLNQAAPTPRQHRPPLTAANHRRGRRSPPAIVAEAAAAYLRAPPPAPSPKISTGAARIGSAPARAICSRACSPAHQRESARCSTIRPEISACSPAAGGPHNRITASPSPLARFGPASPTSFGHGLRRSSLAGVNRDLIVFLGLDCFSTYL
jgi:hypothetical protein